MLKRPRYLTVLLPISSLMRSPPRLLKRHASGVYPFIGVAHSPDGVKRTCASMRKRLVVSTFIQIPHLRQQGFLKDCSIRLV